MADYITASFGGLDLLVTDVETEEGRDVVVQSPARGDKHVLQDRGKKLLSVSCTMLFVSQPNKPDFMLRFDQLRQMANLGGPTVFAHPLIGSFISRLTEFSHRGGVGTGMITCSGKFLAEDEPTVIVRQGAGVSTVAGLEAVSAAAYAANTAIAASGFPAVPYVSNALAAATEWAAGDSDFLDSNTVFSDMASLSGELATTINDLELLSNVSNYQAYRALITLGYQLSRAADAFTSDADNVFDLTVVTPRPLIAICAEIYGAALAQDRADSIAQLNRIARPGLVPVGTYKFPSDGASP